MKNTAAEGALDVLTLRLTTGTESEGVVDDVRGSAMPRSCSVDRACGRRALPGRWPLVSETRWSRHPPATVTVEDAAVRGEVAGVATRDRPNTGVGCQIDADAVTVMTSPAHTIPASSGLPPRRPR